MCGESQREIDDEHAQGGVDEDVEKVEGARILFSDVGDQGGEGDVEYMHKELAQHLLGDVKDPKGAASREGYVEGMDQRMILCGGVMIWVSSSPDLPRSSGLLPLPLPDKGAHDHDPHEPLDDQGNCGGRERKVRWQVRLQATEGHSVEQRSLTGSQQPTVAIVNVWVIDDRRGECRW